MTLEEFNSKYIYKKDIDKYGFNEVWEIPKLQEDGKYYMDCEDYCLFLKNNIKHFKDWDFYFCKLNGNGHCILYKNGDVIDCNCKTILNLETYTKLYNPTDLKKYSAFTLFSKILIGKILTLVSKVKK